MKRILSFIIFWIGFAVATYPQVGIGLRDTRYFNIHYSFSHSYYAEIEQSAFSLPLCMQKTRLYLGYFDQVKTVRINLLPYGSIYWGGDCDYGAEFRCSYPIRRLEIFGSINPHYDNILKFSLRYEAGAKVRLLEHGGLSASYTTISPYRTPEKLFECGIWIKAGKLGVWPIVAFPIDTPEKYLRVMCNFNYDF